MDCSTIVNSTVCVEANIKLNADVDVGEVTTHCIGEPYICQHQSCDNKCELMVHQKLEVCFPLTYLTNVTAKSIGVACEKPKLSSTNPECACDPGKGMGHYESYENQSPYEIEHGPWESKPYMSNEGQENTQLNDRDSYHRNRRTYQSNNYEKNPYHTNGYPYRNQENTRSNREDTGYESMVENQKNALDMKQTQLEKKNYYKCSCNRPWNPLWTLNSLSLPLFPYRSYKRNYASDQNQVKSHDMNDDQVGDTVTSNECSKSSSENPITSSDPMNQPMRKKCNLRRFPFSIVFALMGGVFF